MTLTSTSTLLLTACISCNFTQECGNRGHQLQKAAPHHWNCSQQRHGHANIWPLRRPQHAIQHTQTCLRGQGLHTKTLHSGRCGGVLHSHSPTRPSSPLNACGTRSLGLHGTGPCVQVSIGRTVVGLARGSQQGSHRGKQELRVHTVTKAACVDVMQCIYLRSKYSAHTLKALRAQQHVRKQTSSMHHLGQRHVKARPREGTAALLLRSCVASHGTKHRTA